MNLYFLLIFWGFLLIGITEAIEDECHNSNIVMDIIKRKKLDAVAPDNPPYNTKGIHNMLKSYTDRINCKYDLDSNLKKKDKNIGYIRTFPGLPTILAMNSGETNYDYINGKNNHLAKAVRDFMSKEMWQKYAHQFEPDYIMKMRKLPNGMRYATDYRYLGGIPPTINGTFNPFSIRRWIRPVPISQCGSTCMIALSLQTYHMSRPAQLGENARMLHLGGVPYCTPFKIDKDIRYEQCDASKSQMSFYDYYYSAKKESNGSITLIEAHKVPKQTWVPIQDHTYALNTDDHNHKRPIRIPGPTFPFLDDAMDLSGVSLPSQGQIPKNASEFHFDGANLLISKGLLSKFKPDMSISNLIDAKYRVTDWNGSLTPYACIDNHLDSCDYDPALGRPKNKIVCTNKKTYKRWDGKNPLTCKGDHYKQCNSTYGPGITRSSSFDTPLVNAEIGEPFYYTKNQGNFLTKDFHRASPAVLLAWLIDNHGPIGFDVGSPTCTGNVMKPGYKQDSNRGSIDRLIIEMNGWDTFSKVLYPDLFMNGYGDTLDSFSRQLTDKICPFPFMYQPLKQFGSGAHSITAVGYKFFPNKPNEIVFVLMDSHLASRHYNRGFYYRAMPLTVGIKAINGVHIIRSDFSKYGLNLKYYYDGSEEVPQGSKGGTNEVRGRSKYDWTQTVDYHPSGTSNETVGNGTNGKHCGFGRPCNGTHTPFIVREKLVNFHKNTTSRLIVLTPTINITSSNADDDTYHTNVFRYNEHFNRALQPCISHTLTIPFIKGYKAIGGASLCYGGTANSAKTYEKCTAACNRDPTCSYFSFNYASSVCTIKSTLGDYDKNGVGCNTICYKKEVDTNPDIFQYNTDITSFIGLKNRYCKLGTRIVNTFFNVDINTCSTQCRNDPICRFFTLDVGACDLFSSCNIEIFDRFNYDYSDLPSMKDSVFHPVNRQPVFYAKIYTNGSFTNNTNTPTVIGVNTTAPTVKQNTNTPTFNKVITIAPTSSRFEHLNVIHDVIRDIESRASTMNINNISMIVIILFIF